MSATLLFSRMPMCMIAALVAISLSFSVTYSQEASDSIVKEAEAIKTEPEAKAEAKAAEESSEAAKPEPAKVEESESAEKPTKPAGKEEAKPKDGAKSKENQEKKPKNAEGPKQDKEGRPELPQPRKLGKLGSTLGPMLPGQPWRVHDFMRPRPPVVTPGELSTYDKPGTPPSDAIVLFDGSDLSHWCHASGQSPDELIEAQWKVENGYFEIAPRTGTLQTIDSFGSCQFHIEWQAPAVVKGDSQQRGNSGVYFMGEFEVQILDSYNNRTYADGQAGALYGQYPPMVNACRKPGEWQIYDILFQAPKFSLDGKLERPASVTVIHNGVFLHNAQQYVGKSGGGVFPKYDPLSPAAPLRLQDHGNPVRFRNIWIRPLVD